MTNHFSFQVEKEKKHACYFAIASWLSNFCPGFRAPLNTFSPKMESLCKCSNTDVEKWWPWCNSNL